MAKKPASPQQTTKKYTARAEREQQQVKAAITVTGIVLGIVLIIVAIVLVNNYIIRPNTVVASVGETKIKAGEFDKSVRYARDNMLKQANQYYMNYYQFQSFSPEYAQQFLAIAQRNAVELNQGDVIGNRVLNDMIDDIIIAEEAEKLGITVSNEELDKYIEENFGFYADGTPTPANTATPFNTPTISSQQETLIAPPATEEPTDEEAAEETEAPAETESVEETEEPTEPEPEEEQEAEVEEPEATPTVEGTATPVPTITPSPTPYTRRLFQKEYNTYRSDLNKKGIPTADIQRILKGALLRLRVMEAITEDVPAEEEQVWARHILVASKDEADAVIERLNAGEDFAVLAQELSTDQGSKGSGGDLGWFGRGRMVLEFEQASYALENIGDISEPVNSQHGWHIIQLIGKGVNGVNEQSHENLKNLAFDKWLDEQRAKRSDIVINDNWEEYMPMKPEIPANFYDAIMNPTGR